MKTVTNYAEKKAKPFLNLLQGYTRGIRFTAILILLLMGVNNAWGADVQKNAIIYFDNSVSQWNYAYHYFAINESYGYKMTKVNNTLLYVHKRTDNTWGGYSSIRLFATTSYWGDPTASGLGGYNNMKSYGANITNTYNNYGFNANNYYYIKPDKKGSTSSHANISVGYLGNSYSSLNKTITIKAKVSTDGGSTYVEATSPGTLSASSYKFTEYNSCATETSLSSGTITCGYTANTTLTAADATGYTFVGWYNSSGTQQTTNKTLSINPTADATYYAYYKANQYTITYKDQGNVAFSGTHASGYPTQHTYGTATTLKTATKIGYTFGGWFTNSDCTGSAVTSLGTTAYTANITLYAKWTEKTYSLTFKHDGNGTIKVGGTTVNSGSTASVNHVTTKTLVATPNTGYNFSDWTLSGSNTSAVTIGNTSTASTTIKATNTGATVTANFTPKTYTITLDKNGGASNGSATATYNSNSVTNATYPTRTDYRCNGYYTATSGGTLVLNTDGTLAKNVSDYTDANGNWTKDGTATLYAQWTYDVTEYTITFGVGTGSTSYGSLNAYNNTTDASITSSAQVRSGQNITFTATPNTGYEVEGWYTNAECTIGKHNAGNTTYTTTITAATNVYVKFVEKTWSVSFAATTGGTVEPSATQTVGEANGVTVIAEAKTGYTFNGWTSSNGGSFEDATADNTTFKPTAVTTVTASFTEKLYAITVKSSDNNHGTITQSTDKAGIATTITVTATPKLGYRFVNWTATSGITIADPTSATTTITATGTGTITATFHETGFIYFKNNPGWSNVYVYFHTGEYWDNSQGSGSYGMTIDNKKMAQMERIGNTDIYRCHYGKLGVTPSNVIAFTESQQENYGNFWDTKAAYRVDFNTDMELFIPQEKSNETKNEKTKYYSSGIWMKYNSIESGYNLVGGFNSWNDTADKFATDAIGGYHFEVEMLLDAATTYEFKIKKDGINDWFGKNSTKITSANNINIDFVGGEDNAKITTTSAGVHIFSIDLSEGKMNLSVEYPLISGDYRLVYVESEVQGTAPYTKFHPAQSIRHQAEGEKKDTISFYINKTTGKNPAILLQQCSINGATITWNDVAIQYINGNQGRTPGGAMAPAKRAGKLYIGSGCSAVTENGVYNFVLQQTGGNATILSEETHPYTGDYYIRTDCADGGWRKYNTNKDNIMTHSKIALTYGGYDYYFCKWVENADTNIKYTIANDYNYCVSDTLDGDTIATAGTLPAKANVRFTWNSSKNILERGYIAGSSNASDRYLVLEGNEFLLDVNGKAFDIDSLDPNEALFEDMGNWIYQLDVQANNKTAIKLTAKYNKKVQTFFSTDTVANATSSDYYKVRFVYDFKTNNLVAAWLLEDENEVDGGKSLNSNMFIIRKHHEQAQQIKLNDDLSGVGTAYGVMTFDKYFLNNRYSEGINKGTELPENQRKSINERALYWISFPFDVCIKDVFGFGDYMDTWIMEYYDGEARAKNGAWVDSETYWTYITNLDDTLKAGTGYVLCLDLEKMQYNSSVFRNTDEVSLYFPSTDTIGTIKSDQAVSITLPAHECTITRDDRNIYDSNWNLIGVPRFINLDIALKNPNPGSTQDSVVYYYEYLPATDSYTTKQSGDTTTFQTMSAYMVQFAGTINWWEQANFPSSLAARRNTNAKTKSANLRLELTQDDAMVDQTFIQLQEEGATAEFDMNKDLTKIMNQGANIYSLIGNSRIRTAGNVLPLEEVVVPVGVTVSTAGTYTFAMPDGTDGITAILIDYETGKETNLLIADYTTELREGTNNERFALRVRPNHVATEVETIIDGANGQIQKYIINGALYILNNGQLYDAQGRMVQP